MLYNNDDNFAQHSIIVELDTISKMVSLGKNSLKVFPAHAGVIRDGPCGTSYFSFCDT